MTATALQDSQRACTLLLHGGLVVCDAEADDGVIRDGAVAIQDDKIIAVGNREHLRRIFVPARELGSPQHVLMPGLINAHDHLRAPSTVALGIADDGLEPWLIGLMNLPGLDVHASATMALIAQLRHGITTTAPNFFDPRRAYYEAAIDAAFRAARALGMRMQAVLGTLDRSPVGALLAQAQRRASPALARQIAPMLQDRPALAAEDYTDLLRGWASYTQGHALLGIAGGPVSPHWCSDALLAQIDRCCQALDLPMQMHLLESPLQARDDAVVARLNQLRLWRDGVSCAHGVHLRPQQLDMLARHSVSIVHNPGSNLRLRNGIAPVAAMLDAGAGVALGLDSLPFGAEGDLLGEMRLAELLHRDDGVSARRVVAMATRGGARALGLERRVGSLEVGKQADILMFATDPGTTLAEADWAQQVLSLQTRQLQQVLIAGRIVMAHGRPTASGLHVWQCAMATLLADLARAARQTDRTRTRLIGQIQDLVRSLD
ncbi:MAG: amidohydrolase family protein [Pseudomonas sp.]